MLKASRYNRKAYSLTELLAVVSMLGLLAAIVLPRLALQRDTANASACHVNQGDIELQVELWLHDTDAMPASNLSDIGADLSYFPEGLPSCPVDGTAYTIDTSTGLIIGHSH